MPILIKDMEMPKNCYSCDFGAFYSDGQMYCKRKMHGVMTGLKRPDWCQLIEVKRPKYDAQLLLDCGMEE